MLMFIAGALAGALGLWGAAVAWAYWKLQGFKS